MNLLREICAWLPVIGLLAIVIALPFQFGWWVQGMYYFLAFGYILDYVLNRRWRNWHWEPNKIVFIAFILFSFLVPISQLIDTVCTSVYTSALENVGPFLFVGLCGLVGTTDKFHVDYFGWAMLIVSVIIVGVLIAWTEIYTSTQYAWIELFNLHRTELINTHMVLNMYWNISLVLGMYMLVRGGYSLGWRIVIGGLMCAPLFAILISEGRTGVITTVLIIMISLLYVILRSRRWQLWSLWIVLCIGAACFLWTKSSVQGLLRTPNPRIYQWEISMQMIRERPWLGYGVSSAREEYIQRVMNNQPLKDLYIEPIVEKDPRYRQNGEVNYRVLHPHSVFLETGMRYGIIGLLVLSFCLLSPFAMRLGKGQFYMDLCVVIYIVQAFMESLSAQCNAMYLCVPVLLFYITRSKADDTSPSCCEQ